MAMKEKLTVVKVGGKVVDDHPALQHLVSNFSAIRGRKVLVHGGGVLATQLAAQLGIETIMVNGRRITDDKMIDIVTMVYAGLANKRLVAMLQGGGQQAIGMTGADMNVILSRKRPITPEGVDYGWVGDPISVNAQALSQLIEQGVVPVMAPLTHDGCGHMLNTNADTIAAETAKALASTYDVTLVFCFEKRGVLLNETDDNSVVPVLTRTRYASLLRQGIIKGGMIPKLDNAFSTVDCGVREVVITKASNLNNAAEGTHITPAT